MTPYLFFVFGAPGADDLYVLLCSDDTEARARADWLLTLEPGRDCVEAWDEARLVGVAWADAPALAATRQALPRRIVRLSAQLGRVVIGPETKPDEERWGQRRRAV